MGVAHEKRGCSLSAFARIMRRSRSQPRLARSSRYAAIASAVAAAINVIAPPRLAQAANDTYTPANTSDLWSIGTDWTTIPGSGNSLIFSNSGSSISNTNTDDIPGAASGNIIGFALGNGTTLGGTGSGTININAAGTNQLTSGGITINVTAVAGNLYNFNIPIYNTGNLTFAGNGTGTFNIQGGIGASGNLSYTGNQTLNLGGTNTYYGTTTVSGGGTLQMITGGSVNPLTVVTVTGNSTFDLDGTNQSIAGIGNASSGVITNSGSTNSTLTLVPQTGNYTTTTSLLLKDGATNTLAIQTGVSNGLNSSALGYIAISNGSNSYTGGTSVNGTALLQTVLQSAATSGTPFGTGNFNLNDGILKIAGGGNITVAGGTGAQFNYAAGGILSLTSNNILTIGSGSGVLNRTDNGTMVITPVTVNTLGNGTTQVIVNGNTTGLTNSVATTGIVDPSIIGFNTSVVNGSAIVGADFLTYGNTSGFAPLAVGSYTGGGYTSGNLTATNGGIYNVAMGAAGNTIAGSAYSMIVNGYGNATAGFAPTITTNFNVGVLGNGTNAPDAALIINGNIGNGTSGNSTILGNGTINFGSSQGIVFGFGTVASIAPTLAGSAGVVVSGGTQTVPDLVTLSSINTFTGNLTLEGDTALVAGTSDALLGLTPTATNSTFGNASNSIILSGGGIASTGNASSVSGSRSIVISPEGGVLYPKGVTLIVNSNISGTGALSVGDVQNTAGEAALTGNNSYSGGTVISSSTTTLGVPEMLIASDANIGGANTPITIVNGALGIQSLNATPMTGFGSHPVSFLGEVNFDIENPGSTFAVSQPLANGNSTLFKEGPGSLILTGQNTETQTGRHRCNRINRGRRHARTGFVTRRLIHERAGDRNRIGQHLLSQGQADREHRSVLRRNHARAGRRKYRCRQQRRKPHDDARRTGQRDGPRHGAEHSGQGQWHFDRYDVEQPRQHQRTSDVHPAQRVPPASRPIAAAHPRSSRTPQQPSACPPVARAAPQTIRKPAARARPAVNQ